MPLVYQPVLWRKEEIIHICKAQWLMNEPNNLSVKGVCITPELCSEDYIYIALGKNSIEKRVDLLIEALKKKVSAVIVDKYTDEIPQWASVLLVKNTIDANIQLAVNARDKTRATIIAVTGSVGKTSTKDIIAQLLSNQALTYSNYRSINGGPGLKTQIANISKNTDYCVMEFGMKAPNTIKPMSEFLKPHISLITAIAPAHFSYHENIDSIVKTKAQIVDGMLSGGHVVLPRDSQHYNQLKKYVIATNKNIQIHSFGKHKYADVRLISHTQNNVSSVVNASIFGIKLQYEIPIPGYLWVINSLAALACISLAGADIIDAAKNMGLLKPVFRRGERFRVKLKSSCGVIEVVDDTWNANPMAMYESISQLSTRKKSE